MLVAELFDGLESYRQKLPGTANTTTAAPARNPAEEEENKALQKEFEAECKKVEEAMKQEKLEFKPFSLDEKGLVKALEGLAAELSNTGTKNSR